MSEAASDRTRHPLQPFSFDDWNGEHVTAAPVDFAERRAELHAADAEQCECHGNKEAADAERAAALWWRGLNHLPADEGEAVERDAWLDASELITALLARANVSDAPLPQLCALAKQIHQGLNALAAHGNKAAGSGLLNSLFQAVDDFNMLAFHSPDVFKNAASHNAGIPGIITPHQEKTKANKQLVEKLAVASKYVPLKARKKKLPHVFSTAANLWATRLYHYIEEAQRSLKTLAHPVLSGPVHAFPPWSSQAIFLPPFSPSTWEKWADVAWEVIKESTGGHPENQPELRPLGEAAGKVRHRHCGSSSEQAQENKICRGIETRIKGAFKVLSNGG